MPVAPATEGQKMTVELAVLILGLIFCGKRPQIVISGDNG